MDHGLDTATIAAWAGRDVETTRAGALDHLQAFRCGPQAAAVEVHDVDGNTGDGACRDHLADGLDARARLDPARTSQMNKDGQAVARGEPADLDHLEAGGAGRVLEPHPDAQGAGADPRTQPRKDALEAVERRGFVG